MTKEVKTDLIRYWIKHLLLFNLLVIGMGVITALIVGFTWLFWEELISSLIWIAICNLLFLVGFLVDILMIRFSAGRQSFVSSRDTYFWVVSITLAIVTIAIVNICPVIL